MADGISTAVGSFLHSLGTASSALASRAACDGFSRESSRRSPANADLVDACFGDRGETGMKTRRQSLHSSLASFYILGKA